LEQALVLRIEMRDLLGEGQCHLVMGEWLFRIGGAENLDKADVHLGKARDAFEKADYLQQLQRVFFLQAKVMEARGRLDEAEKRYNEALTILESLTYRLPDDLESGKKLNVERSEPYEALVGLLIKQDRLPEALAYMERSRDQNLAKDLIGGTSEEASYQAKIAALRERIEQAKSQQDSKLAELLAKEAEGVQEAYSKHVEDLFRDKPQLHALIQVNPDALNRMRKLLDPQSLMILYFFYEDALYVFAVTSDKLEYRTVKVDKRNLEARITYLRDLLRVSFRFFPSSVERMDQSNAKWRERYEKTFLNPVYEVGNTLYKELLGPLEDLLVGKTRINIIPNQCLHHLPFAALVKSFEGGQPKFLVEDFELLKQGSFTLLDFARVRSVPEQINVLAVGNADGTLPNAQEEAEKIKIVFPTARLLVREQAKEDVIKDVIQDATRQMHIVHLATHAFLDPGDLDKCFIKLAPSWEKGQDGFLWRREVLDLRMDEVRLVALSACETGIGERRLQGDTVYGLEQSFVVVGAKTVLATLWPVEDRATGLFMQNFYENLVQSLSSDPAEQKMKKLQSLRTAQLSLLNSEQYFHPYFWAPFVMTGEAE